MKFLIVIFFCTLTLTTLGQERVELGDLKEKTGKLVTVSGKVDSISTTGKGDLRSIVIYVGGKSPKELL